MIIISQDKSNIINFNNIINIEYNDYTNISGGHEIYCYTTKTEIIVLGIYKTEERAKEILEEIVTKYENSMWKLGKDTISFQEEFIYRMPLE